MKRLYICILLIFLFISISCGKKTDIVFPKPQGYVNDFTYLLTTEENNYLEYQLTILEEDTTAEVVVITIDSLEGHSIEDYAVGLFEAWGIGKKDKDNGILLLLAIQEQLVKIEVGYGLEEIITDGRAGNILDLSFNEVDYATGIINSVDYIEQYLRDGTLPIEPEGKSFSDRIHLSTPILIITGIIAFAVTSVLSRRNIIAGGLLGIIAGIFIGLSYGGWLAIVLSPIIMLSGGGSLVVFGGGRSGGGGARRRL